MTQILTAREDQRRRRKEGPEAERGRETDLGLVAEIEEGKDLAAEMTESTAGEILVRIEIGIGETEEIEAVTEEILEDHKSTNNILTCILSNLNPVSLKCHKFMKCLACNFIVVEQINIDRKVSE